VCGFVHFRELKVGVSVLVEREKEVLLVERNIDPGMGKWCLPSGFVEWDEAPEAAAARECLEETGLVVTRLELVDASHYTDDFRGPGINLTYRAQVGEGDLKPGDDAAAARWFRRDSLPDFGMVAFPNQCLILEQWREA
jgi:ADP-ribose pyrophosphatase YjhB (NUDIX family)